MTDTIFALATPPGRGAVAVIRLSGPATRAALTGLDLGDLKPRQASLRRLRDSAGSEIDQALVLWFPGPASFTGEDCAELHLHGGLAVVAAATDALLALGLRLAEPGEFTRRAFQNGKLDLAQAEAVADLVDAETTAQRDQALRQLEGALSRRYETWRDGLIHVLAMLEAAVDFPDEELPEDLANRARPGLEALIADLDAALADGKRGERIRDGFRIALTGEPNAGKSSLFNALVGRDAAIVTPIAGTTRDVLDAELMIGGYAVTLSDTAGLRESDDLVEAEGIRRARLRAQDADLRVWVRAPDEGQGDDPAAAFAQAEDLQILNKADLGAATAVEGLEALSVSTTTGEGLSDLPDWIAARLARDLSGADFPAVTRERHRRRLVEALAAVEAGRRALDLAPEMAGDDLRRAADALARVTGAIGVEDILGEVFSTFCIGK